MTARRSRVATPLAKKRAQDRQTRVRQVPPRLADGSSVLAARGELDPVAQEMAQLTEGERVKRWLQGIRVADERIHQLRADEAATRATAGAPRQAGPGARSADGGRRNTQHPARSARARANRGKG